MIRITTIKSLVEALKTPGVLLWVERHDVLGPRISRDPTFRDNCSAPRTVTRVQSKAVVFALADGTEWVMTFPKASDLTSDGTNRFSVRCRNNWRPGEEGLITFRIEEANSEGALRPPSPTLAELYPSPTEDELTAERNAATALQAAADAAREKLMEQYALRRERQKPAADPRYAGLDAAYTAAIEAALDAGKFYEDEVTKTVMEAVKPAEFLQIEQLPDARFRASNHAEGFVTDLDRMDAKHALSAHARGTWQLWFIPLPDGTWRREGAMSLGNGEVYCATPLHEGGFNEIYTQAAGTLCYRLRKNVVEPARLKKRNADLISQARIAVGREYKNLVIDGNTYSTATVSEFDEACRIAKLQLRKRGSRTRWNCEISEASLAAVVERCRKEAPMQAMTQTRPLENALL